MLANEERDMLLVLAVSVTSRPAIAATGPRSIPR